MLDEWLTCQGKWLYLEPIFGAEEIMQQIPKEGNAFRSMDASWRRIMAQVRIVLNSCAQQCAQMASTCL
jgi:dynein heavy chain